MLRLRSRTFDGDPTNWSGPESSAMGIRVNSWKTWTMLRSRSAPALDHKNRRQRGKPYTEDTERFCISNCRVIFSLCRSSPQIQAEALSKENHNRICCGNSEGAGPVFLVAACTNIHIQYSITVLIIHNIHTYISSYTSLLHASIIAPDQFISDPEVQEMKWSQGVHCHVWNC